MAKLPGSPALNQTRLASGKPRQSGSARLGIKPHLKQQFVIPPEANAAFVAAMEDVLEVYHRPHDPACPVVCVDETSKAALAAMAEEFGR